MSDIFKRLERLARSNFQDLFASEEKLDDADTDERDAMDELNDFLNQSHSRRSYNQTFNRFTDSSTEQSIPKELYNDYTILEIQTGSDLAAVKDAYKRLLRKYHPDRHQNNEEAMKLATHRTASINVSYKRIKSFLETGTIQ